MYAVIQTQGRQYKVSEGDTIVVDHIPGAPAGSRITFEEVLMTGGEDSRIGTPLVEGASVLGEVTEQGRGPKLIIFKKRRRRANSATTQGFRSHVTSVLISKINA
jgi:large subunit ribosomal protein L21